ncbi:MAG: M15 family metallopeptidase [Candidatus Nomurabacteria bacterium]|nr:M15 family metallopeptidase [Candidatus Nomurabacteria bacterium]
MKAIFNKFLNLNNLGFLIIGIAVFGLISYINYRFYGVEKMIAQSEAQMAVSNNQNQKKIKEIYDLINNTQSTQSSIASVLEQEKQKNSILNDQFSEITNTVGALEKLSTTDPELLKKYSKVYFLNEHYIPVSLAEVPAEYRDEQSVNYQFLTDALPFLQELIDAGNSDGVSIKAFSAYRSFATQSTLKDAYKVAYGSGANTFSADQGYSEHQLGTALDFTTSKTSGILVGFSHTPEYKWLVDNGYKYGFVISYPDGNAYYKFEPWHWRFVGVALATRLHEENKYFYDEDQRTIDNYLVNIFDK